MVEVSGLERLQTHLDRLEWHARCSRLLRQSVDLVGVETFDEGWLNRGIDLFGVFFVSVDAFVSIKEVLFLLNSFQTLL